VHVGDELVEDAHVAGLIARRAGGEERALALVEEREAAGELGVCERREGGLGAEKPCVGAPERGRRTDGQRGFRGGRLGQRRQRDDQRRGGQSASDHVGGGKVENRPAHVPESSRGTRTPDQAPGT
jgi:hypothetical protein